MQDAPTIASNIQHFHSSDEHRMLFLSPEGVVVDFGPKDIEYIRACRQFCTDQGYEPFDYVLTPRYKGSMSLLQQVQGGQKTGPVISVCIAYVRNGKLLNCSLLSPDRMVPDIYTLNQGIGGSPVDIFIHLKRMALSQDITNPKAFMMENYKEKNDILKEWDRQISAGTADSDAWKSQFTAIESNRLECILYQIGHAVLMTAAASIFNCTQIYYQVFACLFFLVAGCHTLGWVLNYPSMESVPFETAIKAVLLSFDRRRKVE